MVPGLIVKQRGWGMGAYWYVGTKVADEEDRRGAMPVFYRLDITGYQMCKYDCL